MHISLRRFSVELRGCSVDGIHEESTPISYSPHNPTLSNQKNSLWCSWISRSAVIGSNHLPKGHRLDSGRGDVWKSVHPFAEAGYGTFFFSLSLCSHFPLKVKLSDV